MIDSDLAQFSKILDSLSEYYQRDPLSPMAIKIYFSALQRFPIESIGEAVNKHIQHPTNGKFYPKAADFILHLEGGAITADQVVAAAKLADTPFGIMARIHIGTWDLKNMNGFDLKQRAEEVLQLLPKWNEYARDGRYSDHQISIMIKHGVDPHQPFHAGLAAPVNNKEALADRIFAICSTKRHQELMDDSQPVLSTAPVPLSQTLAKLEQSDDYDLCRRYRTR